MNSESTLSDALSEVDTALAASDNERAASLASELLLAYPNAVTVLRARARALAAAGRSLQAAEVHRRVLEILPADGEAMAGLAHTLHSAGQQAEARDAARQALDYFPSDEALKRIAASEGLPFQPEQTSMHLFKARIHAQAGLNNRGAAGLRSVVAKWPERTDVKVALMQTLWRKGARIAAAEQAQAVLDEYPSCLNAHLLMLEMWRDAGASDMERVHLQAIDQVDPDHRATRAMLGTQSLLPVQDVPARPAQPTEPAPADEDPLAREAWVDSLMAESSALPKPLEQRHDADDVAGDVVADGAAGNAEAEIDEPSEFVSSLLPLEWSAANDLSEESATDDFGVSWLDGNVKDEFAPARPRAAQPDPNDGVPAELPALEWESEGDESAPQKDHRTAVDGGIAQREETPAASASEETRVSPLKPLAAAGIVAAAVQRDEEKPDNAQQTRDAGAVSESTAVVAEAQAAPTEATVEQTSAAIAQAAEPDSAPQQERVETEAAQGVQVEMESALMTPTPVEAVEAIAAQPDAVQHELPAEAPVVVGEAAPARKTEKEKPASEPASEQDASILKAVAVASAISAAVKRRKKKAEKEAEKEAEIEAEIEAVPAETSFSTQSIVLAAPAVEPAPLEIAHTETLSQAIAPAEEKPKPKKATADKAAKPKPVKKPAAKPTTLETQTEKVRKTYERAIATAKREELPKLIKELNQAAERDPDNKIIFELLGQAYNRSGDIPAAIDAYRKALALAEHS